jgi:hypothetical protein
MRLYGVEVSEYDCMKRSHDRYAADERLALATLMVVEQIPRAGSATSETRSCQNGYAHELQSS